MLSITSTILRLPDGDGFGNAYEKVKKGMKRLSTIAIVLLFAAPIAGVSQSVLTDSLSWEAVEVTNLQTMVTSPSKCLFQTSDGTVLWIQRYGALTNTYAILTSTGTWPSVLANGTISFQLSRNGKASTMVVERTNAGVFITMDFSVAGEFDSRHRFKIISVKPPAP